jgi:hypothetical protein
MEGNDKLTPFAKTDKKQEQQDQNLGVQRTIRPIIVIYDTSRAGLHLPDVQKHRV